MFGRGKKKDWVEEVGRAEEEGVGQLFVKPLRAGMKVRAIDLGKKLRKELNALVKGVNKENRSFVRLVANQLTPTFTPGDVVEVASEVGAPVELVLAYLWLCREELSRGRLERCVVDANGVSLEPLIKGSIDAGVASHVANQLGVEVRV